MAPRFPDSGCQLSSVVNVNGQETVNPFLTMAWRGPPQFGTLARGRFCPLERSPIPQRPAVATASQRAKTRTATRSHPHPSPSRPDRARPALPQGLAATTSLLIYLAFSPVRCRYRAERLANRASQHVENPWNTIPVCSRPHKAEVDRMATTRWCARRKSDQLDPSIR